MLGFVIGTVCLIGLFKVARRARYGGCGRFGYGYGGHGGGCGGREWGHSHHGPFGGGWGRRDEWDDDDDVGFGGGRRGGFFGLRAIFQHLDTTPGQEKVIRAAFDELRAKARAAKDDVRGTRVDLASAFRGEALDAETLGTVASRMTGAVDAVRDAGIGAVLKVHDVLDERQRKIVADLLESGPRFGGWRRGGGPYRGAWGR